MDIEFLYLDESGDPGWPRGYGGNSDRYFVYAGVILTSDQNVELQDALGDLMTNHFDGLMNVPEEIHYADAVHGNGAYDQLSPDERSEFRNDLFEIILDIEPTLMASVVDKQRMRERYGDDAHNPKEYAFRATIDRFHKHLNEMDSAGVVTIDSTERSFDRELRRLIYDAQQYGIKISSLLSYQDTTLPRILDTVTMTPSEMSPGIQLADVVAYQVFSEHHYKGTSHGYEALENLFRDPQGTSFVEPSVIPRPQ